MENSPSLKPLRVAVLVASDSVAAGRAVDSSGKAAIDRMNSLGHTTLPLKVVPDEMLEIQSALEHWCDHERVDLILTSGGTGLSPRDVTPDATLRVIQRQISGISETIRAYGQTKIQTSMLSRAVAGTRGTTVIVNLPGSRKGVEESLDVLVPVLPHIYRMMRGEKH